jgi:tryptophanyl-tRNA synthetase
MQQRRAKYEQNPRLAWDILEAGSAKARAMAENTMERVRAAMNMSKEYEPPAAAENNEVTTGSVRKRNG